MITKFASAISCLFFPFSVYFNLPLASVVTAVIVLYGAYISRSNSRQLAMVSLLFFLLMYWEFAGRLFFWPLHLLIPVIFMATTQIALRFGIADLRALFTINPGINLVSTAALCLSTVTLSAIGLLIWQQLGGDTLSVYRSQVPKTTLPVIILSAILFSLINAFLEEIVWRGVLLTGLQEAFGSILAIAISSLSFGIAHYHGIPSGLFGVMLSGIYGVLLAIIAVRTKGIIIPIFIHVCTDLILFSILIGS